MGGQTPRSVESARRIGHTGPTVGDSDAARYAAQ